MAEEKKQTEQQGTHCTGDCRRCLPMQRAYCSSQITYGNMKMLEALYQSVAALSQDVKNLDKKIEAITNSEGLFNPSVITEETKDGGNIFAESYE